ncbi:MAG: 1,4-dihydroxy-2-naphthoate octaprenyltransferase [Zoogloeaceae bacterium]|jgi:1,4-dihydroxy-2-naphthoate octaprenyltransferase|nr:1,4-dihydroxy-2-naphthoate octaprenyltransferase [Zoogloeaceae bacterium]
MSTSPQRSPDSPPAHLDVLYAWVLSLRLKTLPLACCGIVLGASLAAVSAEAVWRWETALAALSTALLLQIVANLANDYGDYVKAADTPERLGPRRGMQLGLIRPEQMRSAIVWASALAVLSGLVLMRLSCHSLVEVSVFLGLGLFSLIAAITYTVGRHAYGYHGLGDLSVLVFFGWVSVTGSFYLLAEGFEPRVLVPATACGLLSVLVLNINNLRDLEEDKKHGKITLAVRLGARGARFYHAALLLMALAGLALSAWLWMPVRPWVWLWLLAVPVAFRHLYATLAFTEAQDLRAGLATAVRINLLALGGFSLGLWARFA